MKAALGNQSRVEHASMIQARSQSSTLGTQPVMYVCCNYVGLPHLHLQHPTAGSVRRGIQDLGQLQTRPLISLGAQACAYSEVSLIISNRTYSQEKVYRVAAYVMSESAPGTTNTWLLTKH